MNALCHGMRASVLAALPHEDPAELAAHVSTWLESLAPSSLAETEVARCIALLRWRLRRIEEVENRRQQSEVLHRLDETPEKRTLELFEGTITALETMTKAMTSRLPRNTVELEHIIVLAVEVLKMLRKVEDSDVSTFVGATSFRCGIETLQAHSPTMVDPAAYAELTRLAAASAESVRALLPGVRASVEGAKKALELEHPLPGDRDVALRCRYRRDIEKQLEAELRLLMLLREQRMQLGSLGSFGSPELRKQPPAGHLAGREV